MSMTHACAVDAVFVSESAAEPAFKILPNAYMTPLPLSSTRESTVVHVCVFQFRTRVAVGFSVVPVTTTFPAAVRNVCGYHGAAQLALDNCVQVLAIGS